MGARFGELDEFFSPGLTLTVRRHEYVLPLPSGELGLWCRRIAQVAGEVSDASTDEELRAASERARERVDTLPPLPGADKLSFEQIMLGVDLHAQMLADGVEDPYIEFCARTAYIWIVSGEASAERYWTSGGRPEALGPGNRAQRRAAARTGGTSTAAAEGTPSAASSSGTTTRRRSSRAGRGRGSRGHRS